MKIVCPQALYELTKRPTNEESIVSQNRSEESYAQSALLLPYYTAIVNFIRCGIECHRLRGKKMAMKKITLLGRGILSLAALPFLATPVAADTNTGQTGQPNPELSSRISQQDH